MVAVTVNVTVPFTAGVDVLTVLVTPRSAVLTTAVATVDELFVATGSVLADVTLAVLEIVPAVDGAAIVIVRVVEVPAAKVPTAHVTVPALLVHPADAEVKVLPAGNGSVTVTLDASETPRFSMSSVYVSAPPPVTVAALAVLVMRRSEFDTTGSARTAESVTIVPTRSVVPVIDGRSWTLAVLV